VPRQSLERGCQKSILSARQQFSKVKCANIGAAKTIHHFPTLWRGDKTAVGGCDVPALRGGYFFSSLLLSSLK
jgi:hypothetical protein